MFHDRISRDIEDACAGGQHHTRTEHGFTADADPFHHDGTRPNEGPVLDDDGRGLKRLQNAPDAHAPTQVDVGPDLGAGPHRCPRVHHGPGTDPSSDVHVARHHDHALSEEGSIAGNGVRHHANASFGMVVFEGHLVVELKGADFFHLHLTHGEIQHHGLLDPFVDLPTALHGFSAAQHAAIESIDHRLDRLMGRVFCPQIGVVPSRFNG